MSFALDDPFDLDLRGHQTIGFFPITYRSFVYRIVKIGEELWPVEHEQTDRQTHRMPVKLHLYVFPYGDIEIM